MTLKERLQGIAQVAQNNAGDIARVAIQGKSAIPGIALKRLLNKRDTLFAVPPVNNVIEATTPAEEAISPVVDASLNQSYTNNSQPNVTQYVPPTSNIDLSNEAVANVTNKLGQQMYGASTLADILAVQDQAAKGRLEMAKNNAGKGYSPEQVQQEVNSEKDFYSERLGMLGDKRDTELKQEADARAIAQKSSNNDIFNTPINSSGGVLSVEDAMARIARNESQGAKDIQGGNNPYLVKSTVATNRTKKDGTKYQDWAWGKYQVMGDNIPEWTKQVTGKAMTIDQFLKSPETQDAVVQAQLSASKAKHGTWEDAASVWFSGKPLANNTSRDSLGTSVPEYVKRFSGNTNQNDNSNLLQSAVLTGNIAGNSVDERYANARQLSTYSNKQQKEIIFANVRNKLPVAAKEDYNRNTTVYQTTDYLSDYIKTNPKLNTNAALNVKNNVQSLFAKNDPAYKQFTGLVGQISAAKINELYGAAVSEGEGDRANLFIPDFKKDSLQAVKIKLNNLSAAARWDNDRIMYETLGQPVPKIDEYIIDPVTGVKGGVTKSSSVTNKTLAEFNL